jgi:hypothetical protein
MPVFVLWPQSGRMQHEETNKQTASPAGNFRNVNPSPAGTIQTEADGLAIPAPTGEIVAGHFR